MAYDGHDYQPDNKIETGDPGMDAYVSHLDKFLASPEGERWIADQEERYSMRGMVDGAPASAFH